MWFKKIQKEISPENKSLGINCLILSIKESEDITKGFLNTNYNQQIKWDDTFIDISNLEGIKYEIDEYNSKFIVFNSSVIIGNLKVYDLKIRYPDLRYNRDDVPIDSIWFSIKVTAENASKNYAILKESITKLIGAPSPVYDMTSHWTINGINFCLSTNSSDKATMHIENKRDYANLIQGATITHLKSDETLFFYKKGFHIQCSEFRRNKSLYRTPQSIKNQFAKDLISVVWVTQDREKMGFSNKDYSLVFKMEEIKEIVLQNELPGKGGGSSYLFINPHESANLINVNLRTRLYLFDDFVDDLKTLFGQKFKVLKPRYNA